jgi:hypothetical protein
MYRFRRVYRHRQVVDEIRGACWLLSTESKRSEGFAFRTPTTTMAAQLEDSLSSLGLAIHEGGHCMPKPLVVCGVTKSKRLLRRL